MGARRGLQAQHSARPPRDARHRTSESAVRRRAFPDQVVQQVEAGATLRFARRAGVRRPVPRPQFALLVLEPHADEPAQSRPPLSPLPEGRQVIEEQQILVQVQAFVTTSDGAPPLMSPLRRPLPRPEAWRCAIRAA